jgi:hypothetical protein
MKHEMKTEVGWKIIKIFELIFHLKMLINCSDDIFIKTTIAK